MQQIDLCFETWRDLVCAYGQTGIGWEGPHHCAQCAADVEQACEQFDADVRAGKYDEQGFTPAERRAQAKRRQGR